MDDRELLELAARAAGIELVGWYEAANAFLRYDGSWWNPLAFDSEAFCLAAQMSMNIYINDRYSLVEIISDGDEPAITQKEYCDSETKLTATRRAIVRAAAEIGKEKE